MIALRGVTIRGLSMKWGTWLSHMGGGGLPWRKGPLPILSATWKPPVKSVSVSTEAVDGCHSDRRSQGQRAGCSWSELIHVCRKELGQAQKQN